MTRITYAKRFTPAVFCAVLACFAMPALAQVAPLQEAPIEQNRAFISAAFDRWAAGGSGFFNEVLAPDVVWTIKGSGPSAGTYHGRDDLMARAVRPLATRLSTPIRPVAKRIWAEGDHVVINWDGEALARDGKPYTNSYVWILRMEGGRAAEVTAFLDLVAYDDVLRRIPQPD
ncbi:nuclear transport factor 2 family protein [Pseudomonas sp. TMB3-21]